MAISGKRELSDAVREYFKRVKKEKLTSYRPSSSGFWEIIPPDQREHVFVRGRFVDAVAYMIGEGYYFADWVPSTLDQVWNPNNGLVRRCGDPVRRVPCFELV